MPKSGQTEWTDEERGTKSGGTGHTPSRGEEPQPEEEGFHWRDPLVVLGLCLLFFHLALKYLPTMWGGDWPKDGGFDTAALVLAAFAVLPALASYLASVKLPGGIELGIRVRQLQQRLRMNEEEIRQLHMLVRGYVTGSELNHLQNIAKEQGQTYSVPEGVAPNLRSELTRLLAFGLIDYVEHGKGVRNFAIADGQTRQIKEWFKLTDHGKDYLQMREQVDAETQARRMNSARQT